jgi:hypothetical protein
MIYWVQQGLLCLREGSSRNEEAGEVGAVLDSTMHEHHDTESNSRYVEDTRRIPSLGVCKHVCHFCKRPVRIHDRVKVCRGGEDVNEEDIGPALANFSDQQHSRELLATPDIDHGMLHRCIV